MAVSESFRTNHLRHISPPLISTAPLPPLELSREAGTDEQITNSAYYEHPMRSRPLLALSLFFASSLASSAAESPWETRPELRQLRTMALSVIDDYSDWSDEYRDSGRKASSADRTVNHIAENLLIQVLAALGKEPNAELQRRCLLFLGETVPPEFDHIWNMVLLEMDANLDQTVSREIREILEKKGLPALSDRAMEK